MLAMHMLLFILCFSLEPKALAKAQLQTKSSSEIYLDDWRCWAQLKVLQASPLIMGVIIQVFLDRTIDVKRHPIASSLIGKFMTPINTALTAPFLAPLISLVEKRSSALITSQLTEDDLEEGGTYLEGLWRSSYRHYSSAERSSRYILHEALKIADATFHLVAQNYSDGRHQKAREQIALFSMRMRLLWREVSPTDRMLKGVVRLHFKVPSKNSHLFMKETLAIIAKNDKEFSLQEVQAYYQTLLTELLNN